MKKRVPVPKDSLRKVSEALSQCIKAIETNLENMDRVKVVQQAKSAKASVEALHKLPLLPSGW